MNRTERCPSCQGGGLVPAVRCNCGENAHNCAPAVCTVCMGSGVPGNITADRTSEDMDSGPLAGRPALIYGSDGTFIDLGRSWRLTAMFRPDKPGSFDD